MRRTLHTFFLILSLLFAQAGMVTHASSHLAPVGHAGDEGAPSEMACELCVGYAQLGGGALPSVFSALPVCVAQDEVPSIFATVFVTRSAVYSRARAPPVFS